MRRLGSADVTDLPEGIHYVFVRTGVKGLRYELNVSAKAVMRLEVIPEIDIVLQVSDERAGFAFASETDRSKAGAYATDVVRRWHVRGRVAVIGPMRIDGKPAIVGTVYEESGSVARPMAYILVEDASAESVRALAEYLVDGTVSEKISPAQDSEDGFPSWTARSRRSSSTLPSKVVLGAGGFALLGGAVVYAVSNPGDFVTPPVQ